VRSPPGDGEVLVTSAPTWRRLIASAADGLLVLSLAAIPFVSGLMDWRVYLPPDGLFWGDHLLVLVASRPTVLLHPLVLPVAVGCLWHFVWVYFAEGRTPGMRLARLRIVDKSGGAPTWSTASLRTAAHAVSALFLGLGWVWIFVSAHRRSWSDLASDTWMVTSTRTKTRG
jgi:uncharacterized RDD family membrane protein YckC